MGNTADQFNSLFQEINTVPGQAGIEAQVSMKDLFHGVYVDEHGLGTRVNARVLACMDNTA